MLTKVEHDSSSRNDQEIIPSSRGGEEVVGKGGVLEV